MASYPAPIRDTAVFNSQQFKDAESTALTTSAGDKRYLKYPNAQGTQNMLAMNVQGKATFSNDAVFQTPAKQQLNSGNSWNSSSGPYALAKNVAPVNPVNGAKVTNTTTISYGVGGPLNYPDRCVIWDADAMQFTSMIFSGGNVNNQIRTSPDGVIWTPRSYASVTSQPDWCIAYFPEIKTYIFPLVSANVTNNRVLRSTDGCATFTLHSTPSNNLSYRGCAYSPELDVMVMVCSSVGQTVSNGICYSLDRGVTWNDTSVPAVATRLSVIWVPELKRFFATHLSGFILYSDNGISWQSTPSYQAAAPFQSSAGIAWSRELGMMVGRPADNQANTRYVSYSYDGLTWQYANDTSFFPAHFNDANWVPQLCLWIMVFSSGTGSRMAISPDGLNYRLVSTPSDIAYRATAYSPQLGTLVSIATNNGDPRGFVTNFKDRIPTSWNVFDSNFNRIANDGNWTFKTNSLYTDASQTIKSTNGLELTGTAGTDRQIYTSYTNYRNQNDNVAAGQHYASNGDLIYDNNTNGRSHIFAVNDASGVKNSSALKIDSTRITTTERIRQQLSASTSTTSNVNGFMALDNVVARAPNPTSSGVASVSSFTPQSTANDYSWRGICWSPQRSLFVCVSDSGVGNRVMTSPNGVNWTAQISAVDNAWQSVCWCDTIGLFVAVANSGTGNRVMTSPDGVTWTARTSASDNAWSSVCWSTDLNLIVAVAQSGSDCVMTSPDGINWTARTPPNNNGWASVVYASGLGLFVAVANAGVNARAMTSPNGITWTTRFTPVDNTFTSITYSNSLNLLVAVSNSGTGNRSMYSTDGITWTMGNTTGNDYNWSSVAWSPEQQIFLAVSTNPAITNPFMYSINGISWVNINAGYLGNQWRSVCWSSEQSVFCMCTSGGATGNRVFTSSWRGRAPTASNVFNSPFNSINDTTGDWSIQGTSFTSTQSVTVGSTTNNTTLQTGNIIRFQGASNLLSTTASGSAGQYLVLNVNGTSYKVALLNV